ncbi:MAG TPA: hypothetical protein VF820_05250 [Patescibacteria group bacterium]
MSKNKKLDLDLDFLEKKSTRKDPNFVLVDDKKKTNEINTGTKKKNNFGWVILVIIVIVGYFSFANSKPQTVTVDGYTCSQDNATKAEAMAPDSSTKTNLDNDYNNLNSKAEQLKIDYDLVDRYSQYSVDNYNSELASYNQMKADYNSKVDAYNTSLQSYKNFLALNCTKQ